MSKARRQKRAASWPRIRRRGHGYQVDQGQDATGRRVRRYFATAEDAQDYADKVREARDAERAAERFEAAHRSVKLTAMSDKQRMDAIAAFDRLRAGGVARSGALVEAVEFYLRHGDPSKDSVTVEAAVDLCVKAKEATNRRERTIRDARSKLGLFVADFTGRGLRTITAKDVEDWIVSRGYTGTTRNAYCTAVSGLYAFAIRRGLATSNPVELVERASVERKPPAYLASAEVERLLDTASTVEPRLVPYLALCLFCGLRPEREARLMDWRDVDLAERTVTVPAKLSKTRVPRHVTLSDNAVAWLAPHREAEGTVWYSRKALRDVRDKAGLSDWHQDVARHTFATMHVAAHEDAAKTSLELGHEGNPATLFRYYRGLAKRAEAERFWSIRPREAKVIRLAVATP